VDDRRDVAQRRGAPLARRTTVGPLGPRDVRVAVRAIGREPRRLEDARGAARCDSRIASSALGSVRRRRRRFLRQVVEWATAQISASPIAWVGGTDFSRRQLGATRTRSSSATSSAPCWPPSVSFEQAACLPVAGVTALDCSRARSRQSRVARTSARRFGCGSASSPCNSRAHRGAKAVGVCIDANVALDVELRRDRDRLHQGRSARRRRRERTVRSHHRRVGRDVSAAWLSRAARFARRGRAGRHSPRDYPALIHRDGEDRARGGRTAP